MLKAPAYSKESPRVILRRSLEQSSVQNSVSRGVGRGDIGIFLLRSEGGWTNLREGTGESGRLRPKIISDITKFLIRWGLFHEKSKEKRRRKRKCDNNVDYQSSILGNRKLSITNRRLLRNGSSGQGGRGNEKNAGRTRLDFDKTSLPIF